MTRATLHISIMSSLAILLFSSCVRQRLEELLFPLATIPVEVRWEQSGITPFSGDEQDNIHRVSFRFFPKDGSEPFERHLETNIYRGTIEVPCGEYEVIAMNESVYDTQYWYKYLLFAASDPTSGISPGLASIPQEYAKLLPYSIDQARSSSGDFSFVPLPHSGYTPTEGEQFAYEGHKLATWYDPHFVVTTEMLKNSAAPAATLRQQMETVVVPLQQMHVDVHVKVRMNNINSVLYLFGAIEGFAQKKMMAEHVALEPATIFASFNNRTYEADNVHGTMEYTFRCFGRLDQEGTYRVHLDFILADGTRFRAYAEPLIYDFSDTVNDYPRNAPYIELLIDDAVELPVIDNDITVDPWKDDNNIEIF